MAEDKDTRNVIDYFKHTENLLIKGALDKERHEFSVAMEGFRHDFNIGTLIRNSNAFLAKEIFLLGGTSKQYDKRGAVGTNHYEHILFQPSLAEFKQKLLDEGIHLVIAEDTPEALALPTYEWEKKSCMLFGAEAVGVSEEVLNWVRSGEVPGDIVYIPTFGSVRSLNVGSSSSVLMYDYCAKIVNRIPVWRAPKPAAN